MSNQIEMIPVANVVVAETAIRKVDPTNEDYVSLVEDLRHHSLNQPIWVKQTKDADTGILYYELADGGHRLQAFKDLEYDQIPAIVLPEETTKNEMLSIQFRLNKLRIKQTPTQEGQQFKRMLAEDPSLSAADLALMTGYSVAKIKDRLHFTEDKMTPEVLALVETGAISVEKGRLLAQAGKSMQSADIVESAQIVNVDELKAQINTTKKALAGGDDTPKPKEEKQFEPKFKFRDAETVKKEIENGTMASIKYSDPAQQESFLEGVRWACSLDEQTVTEAQEAFELAKAEAARVKKETELAKTQKRIEEMEKKAAALLVAEEPAEA